MQSIAIIPARYASTRLPGKPLLAETGRPLICHVAERASRASVIDAVIVATDDERIAAAARAAGYAAVMTRADHANGTSRIAEAAAGLPRGYEAIVNVQGDEPEIDPAVIDRLVDRLDSGDEPMATVVCPFAEGEDPGNPNTVKAVVDQRGRCLYFSRSLIPFVRDDSPVKGRAAELYLKHLGIYAYRREFLERYVRLPATPLEQAEQLEQLRAIEHGHAIGAILAERAHVGIDTPEDYAAFVARHRAGAGGGGG